MTQFHSGCVVLSKQPLFNIAVGKDNITVLFTTRQTPEGSGHEIVRDNGQPVLKLYNISKDTGWDQLNLGTVGGIKVMISMWIKVLNKDSNTYVFHYGLWTDSKS